MKAHPYAELFPLMNDIEFEALCEDIKANGCKTPILIYQEKILDGRNRYRACKAVGRDFKTIPYFGDDALGHVLSLNLHRRHLDESQRAMVAARLKTLGKSITSKLLPGSPAEISAEITDVDLGRIVNVSPDSIQSARKVINEGSPSLVRAVDQGEVAVSRAKSVLARPKTEQLKAAKTRPPKDANQLAKSVVDEIIAETEIVALSESETPATFDEVRSVADVKGLLDLIIESAREIIANRGKSYKASAMTIIETAEGLKDEI